MSRNDPIMRECPRRLSRKGADALAHVSNLSLVKTRAALKSRAYALLAPLEFPGEEGQNSAAMLRILIFLVTLGVRALRAMCRRRADLVIENLTLRQQVTALKEERPHPPLEDVDRAF